MYPCLIKKLFGDGCLEYNDYDRNIIRILGQPFKPVQIPDGDTPQKHTADVDTIRKIVAVSPATSRETLATTYCCLSCI